MERSTLAVGLRVVSAVLLVVGVAGVGVAVVTEVTDHCESGYGYMASEVDSGVTPDEWVAFEELSDAEQRAFLGSLDGFSNQVDAEADLPGDLGGGFVRYEGRFYEVVTVVVDCAGNPFILFVFVGVPLIALGLVGLGAGRFLRRRGSY